MKIITLAAAAAVALAAMGSTAAAKTPMTHELLWMMKRVGSPAVSPDGKWVVYSVIEPSYEADKQVSDLWLVATAGGAPRRLTNTKAAEGGTVWSPDSTRIAFTTKREGDEADQVYVLDVVGGGEARRVTSISTGASSPQWRPDGQAILTVTPPPGVRSLALQLAPDAPARLEGAGAATAAADLPAGRWTRLYWSAPGPEGLVLRLRASAPGVLRLRYALTMDGSPPGVTPPLPPPPGVMAVERSGEALVTGSRRLVW